MAICHVSLELPHGIETCGGVIELDIASPVYPSKVRLALTHSLTPSDSHSARPVHQIISMIHQCLAKDTSSTLGK